MPSSSCVPWLAVVAGLAAAACGPSFQAMYEGDVRFEHCYALDQGPANAEVKKDCWQGWLHDYTYGQSRDRVEYAGTRYSELSLDQSLPSEDREVKRAHMASPVPTSAFAPPPSVAAERATAEASTATPSPAVEHPTVAARAPGEECAEGCSAYWKTCRTSCKGPACDACDKAYKLCGTGCFRK